MTRHSHFRSTRVTTAAGPALDGLDAAQDATELLRSRPQCAVSSRRSSAFMAALYLARESADRPASGSISLPTSAKASCIACSPKTPATCDSVASSEQGIKYRLRLKKSLEIICGVSSAQNGHFFIMLLSDTE